MNLIIQRFDDLKSDDILKFTYADQDNDVISISCDSDLEEALDQAGSTTLTIYIKKYDNPIGLSLQQSIV